MKMHLALRALNETRRSDPISYLSLRYVADNTVSRKDSWAKIIAPEIVRRRTQPTLLKSKQYKEINSKGEPEFREVIRPGGPEALAEVALLDACAGAGGPFLPSPDVYSYRFVSRHSQEGVFIPYFELFSERQRAIRRACEKQKEAWVLYADIKRFYPSITGSRAKKVWVNACDESTLARYWKDFGLFLLNQYYQVSDGLPIGPLFSHLIANLVLRNVDTLMAQRFPKRYFRYVDDFAIVVNPGLKEKRATLSVLRAALKKLGLKLHRGKTHWIGANKWIENAPYQALEEYDGRPAGDIKWMRFIDNVKCYLMTHSDRYPRLLSRFRQLELRVPLPRYAVQVMSGISLERFRARREQLSIDSAVKKLTQKRLAAEGLSLRSFYHNEFKKAWVGYQEATALIRRWRLSGVRYLLTRLLLLGTLEQLREVYVLLRPV